MYNSANISSKGVRNPTLAKNTPRATYPQVKPWQNDWTFALNMDWTNVHLVQGMHIRKMLGVAKRLNIVQ